MAVDTITLEALSQIKTSQDYEKDIKDSPQFIRDWIFNGRLD